MITLTVKDILDNNIPECDMHFIYRFSDDDTTFYIGKSFEIEERLYTHLGVSDRFLPGKILQVVNANRPESLEWTVTLYTMEDTRQYLDAIYGAKGWNIDGLLQADPSFVVSMAEQSMIDSLAPCLNITKNNNRTGLPTRYKV